MSTNPQMMAQMLASQLGGQGQGATGVQQQPTGAAAQLAQKIMLMQALQKGQPPQPAPFMQPGMPQPQAMNAQPMPGGVNA